MSAEMPVSPVSTGVREYDQLSNAFADTSSRLRARTAERAEAERTLSGALNNLSELSKFTEKRFRAESLQDIYDAGLDAILNCLGCSRAAILIADEAKVMRFVAWRGLSLPYRVAVEGHSPWQTDEPDPQIVAVPDVDFEAMPEPLRATIKAEGIGALAFIPVVAGDRLVGKLMSYYDQPHDYNDEEKKLSLELARQIGFGVERKRAENTQRMLVRELQHRTNNLLAVIQGIAQRTFSGAYSLEQSRRLFDGRLRALSRAHRKLTNSNWTGVSLEELVRTELEPFANRANVEGIDVVLTPAYAQNFSLALHELTTNAIKHGALSNADGRLDVAWTVGRYGKDGMLNFRWREHGGPPVLVPLRHGFGTSLLSATFAGARLNYNSDGFCCEFDILLDQVASVPPAASLAAIPAIV
jgi:two-component sensor histidine kinase